MLLLKTLVLVFLINTFVSYAQNVEDRVKQIEIGMAKMMEQMQTFTQEMIAMNDTDELESRVLILELEMDTVQAEVVNLFDDVDELQNQDSLTDIRLTTAEEAIEGLVDSDAAFEDRIASLEAAIAAPLIACESSPCDNGATCVDVNVDTFICLCRDGFFGTTCSNSYADTLFLATIGAEAVTPVPSPIVFNETRLNPGGHYDNATGIYIVPIDGIYKFNVQVFSYTDNDFSVYLVRDGVDAAHTRNADGSGAGEMSTAISVPIHAQAGQEFWVRVWGLNGIFGRHEDDGGLVSWFAGYLVFAD